MLGRLISPDTRDRNYPIRALLSASPPPAIKYWWSNGTWFNQGQTGTCVGHGWAHWIEDGPRTWPGQVDPFAIYRAAVTLDEWPENDHGDLDFGTSVRAGAEAVVAMGRATEYRWAWDVHTLMQTVMELGPVVIGVNWYGDMFEPDAKGLIKVGGWIEGGHCVEVNGGNDFKELARIKNSWGRDWGRNGHAYISYSDLDRLIREDGEACIAIETPRAPR